MKVHLAAATIAAASLLALAACDSRDYEAEIAALEGDLQTTRSENEQLQTELDALRTQAEAEPAMPEGGLENVQTQLNNALQAAASTFERVGTVSEAPDAPTEQREALGVVRGDVQVIVQSLQAAADGLGLELDTVAMDTDADATEGTGVAPAAGPEAPAQEEPAAQDDPPATGEQPAPAQ